MNVGLWPLPQVPPADLDSPIFGQLASAQCPPGDALEPGSLEIVRLGPPFRGGPHGE